MNYFMFSTTLGAATNWGSTSTIGGSELVSRAVSASWDAVWDKVLGGPLFGALNWFGTFIAMGCLLFWLVDWAKKLLEDESGRSFTEIIWPLIVIILLSNGGHNMIGISRSIRSVAADVNTRVLDGIGGQLQLEEKLSAMSDYSSLKGKIETIRAQCNSSVDTEVLKKCIGVAEARADLVLAKYKEQYPDSGVFSRSLEEIKKASMEDPTAGVAKAAEKVGGAVGSVGKKAYNAARNVAFSGTTVVIEIFLIACQAAFQHMIELAMLLTALIAPIAVGSSLLPVGGKAIYLWLTSFWSLALCKISLNVITGVFALAIYQSGPEDTMTHALLIGILAPILAMALSSGGGMAIFNAISQAGAMVVGTAASVGGAAVGQAVGSKLASSVSKGVAGGE